MGFDRLVEPLRWEASDPPLPPKLQQMKEPSKNMFRLLADPNLSFQAICQYVDSNMSPTIYEARILESRVYILRHAHIAPHRKLVLKIRERTGAHFWLLLERKPTSRKALIKGLGTTPANDQVSRGFILRSLINNKILIFH